MKISARTAWLAGVALALAGTARAGVVAPYANDFNAGNVADFTENPDARWSPSGGAYRYVDSASDLTNVSDWAVVTVDNLGGGAESNFTVSTRFTVQSASESPAGTGERLAIMLTALADPAVTSGYFFAIGAGEDIPGFEEGMAFYKNGTYTGQATNFIVQGPQTDGSETWKITVNATYTGGGQIRFDFIAANETDSLVASNSWTDTSGSVLTGQVFGIVVAHDRYTSTVDFDDFEVSYPGAESGLPEDIFFREDFTGSLDDNGWTNLKPFGTFWYGVSNGLCWLQAQSGEFSEASSDYWNLFVVGLAGITTDNFCATMHVLSFEPTNNNVQVSLLAFDDIDNYVRAAYGHIGGSRLLRLFEETGGTASSPADAVYDFGAGSFWLRLTKQGNVYREYWSTNGTIFHKAAGPVTYGDGAPGYLAFWVGANDTFVPNPPTVAQIDSIEVRVFPDAPEVTRIRASGGAVTLSVQNLYEATTARVERCTNLASNQWTGLGDFEVVGDSTNIVDAALSATNRFFYRAVVP